MHSKNGRSAKSLLPLATVALLILSAFVFSACTTGTPANTWLKPNQNAQNTRYVGGRITTRTADILGVAWTADMRTQVGFGLGAPSPFITKKNVFVQIPGGGIRGLDLQTGEPAAAATALLDAKFRPSWVARMTDAAMRRLSGKLTPTAPISTKGKDDTQIVIGANGSKVIAIPVKGTDGQWTSSIKPVGNTKPRVISNMAVAHDNVYVPVANVPADLNSLDGRQLTDKLAGKSSNNGQLVALSTDNGKVSWTKKLASVPLGAATVVNDIVFTSTLDGHVYGFNAGNGDQVFESKLPAGASAPIAAFDGTLVVPAGLVRHKGQKAQVVAFTIGGLGVVGGPAAPKIKQQAAGEVAGSAKGEKSSGEAAPAGPDGAALFAANCAGCHVLAAANAKGTVGPDLDSLKPSEPVVDKQVTNGGAVMPAFKGTLSPEEIKAIAKYVSSEAGK